MDKLVSHTLATIFSRPDTAPVGFCSHTLRSGSARHFRFTDDGPEYAREWNEYSSLLNLDYGDLSVRDRGASIFFLTYHSNGDAAATRQRLLKSYGYFLAGVGKPRIETSKDFVRSLSAYFTERIAAEIHRGQSHGPLELMILDEEYQTFLELCRLSRTLPREESGMLAAMQAYRPRSKDRKVNFGAVRFDAKVRKRAVKFLRLVDSKYRV